MNPITYNPALWQLVPKEPTESMVLAATHDWHTAPPNTGSHITRYKAMLAAAPSAPEQQRKAMTPEEFEAAVRPHYGMTTLRDIRIRQITEQFYGIDSYSVYEQASQSTKQEGLTAYLAAELEPAESVYKVSDVRALLASQPAAPVAAVDGWTNERCEYEVCDEGETHDPKCVAWAAPVEAATPAPSTLGQQVAKAQAEMATWSPELRASAHLEGGDPHTEGRHTIVGTLPRKHTVTGLSVEHAEMRATPAQAVPSASQLIAQLQDYDEKWTPDEQRQFAVFLQRFPDESSHGIMSLGSAWKHGKATALKNGGENV